MYRDEIAMDKAFHTADRLSITDFGWPDPCSRVDLYWADGGHAYVIFDTADEARQYAKRIGFA